MSNRVLVLAQFAIPRGAAGGTRHVELFDRLSNWEPTILAADWHYGVGRKRIRETLGSVRFRTVFTTPYSANSVSRIFNWLSYAISATVAGVFGPRPTVVYASSPPLPVGLAGWLISRIRRTPLVFEVRDLWPSILVEMGALRRGSRLHRLLVALELFVYRRADLIIVLAKGSISHLTESGVDAARVVFLPNGAEPADFASDHPRDLGIDGFVLVYTGAHGPANGLDFLLDAADELKDELPEAQFLLVGNGVEKARLQERATRDSADNVHFLEPIPKSKVPDLLASADAGLHVLADIEMFQYGVSPNKLFDYMAAGLPVITNTPGEVAELVNEAGAGLAVAPGGIAGAVREMIAAGDQRRARWGSDGRTFMEAHRSRRVLGMQLESLLDRVAERRR